MSLICRLWDGNVGSGSYIDITTTTLSYSNLSTYGWGNKISNIEWSTDSNIQNNYLLVAYKNNGLEPGMSSSADAWTFMADMDTGMSTYGFNNNINSVEAVYYANLRESAAILYRDSLGLYGIDGGGGKQQYMKAYRSCNDMATCSASPFWGLVGDNQLSFVKAYGGTKIDLYKNTYAGGSHWQLANSYGAGPALYPANASFGPWFGNDQVSSVYVTPL